MRIRPGVVPKPDDFEVLVVTLRGRLAAPGMWRLEQRRAVPDPVRPFFLVRGIAAEWLGR